MKYNFPPCPLAPGANVVAYTRVSTDTQDIIPQETYLREYMMYHQLNLIRMFSDRGKSGGSMAGRTGLIDLIEFVSNPPANIRIDGALFVDTSRMARDMDDSAMIRATLRQNAVLPIFVNEPTPIGPVARIIEAANDYASQAQLDQARQKSIDGTRFFRQLRHPKTGEYLGIYSGKTPLGYATEQVNLGELLGLYRLNGQPRIMTRLTGPDGIKSPLILKAYELLLSGLSLTEIHERVNLFDPPGLIGYRASRLCNLYRWMFQRTIYRGNYTHNEKVKLSPGERPPDGVEVKKMQVRNRHATGSHIKYYYIAPEVYENFVEPIVSRELWQAAQEQLAKNRQHWEKHRRLGTAKNHALSGLCYCARCGSAMYSRTRTRYDNVQQRKKSTWIYLCGTYEQSWSATCKPRNAIDAPLLDCMVWQALQDNLTVDNIVQLTNRVNELLRQPDGDDLATIQADIANLERRRKNLLALTEEGDKNAESRYRELGRDLKQLEARLSVLLSVERPVLQVSCSDVEQKLAELQGSDLKRDVLREIVARIDIERHDKTNFTARVTPNLATLGLMSYVGNSQHSLENPLTIEIPIDLSEAVQP